MARLVALIASLGIAGCGGGSAATDAAVAVDAGPAVDAAPDGPPPFLADAMPEVVPGHCEVVAPPAEARWASGATPEGAEPAGTILPGGRRVTPAGTTHRIDG